MHIVLTDLLTCPACGSGQGLIARTDRLEDRHIVEGALGCPACRRQYPVEGGVAWLVESRSPRGGAGGESDHEPPVADAEALRIAGLLGLDRVRGFVLLAGPVTRFAERVAALADTLAVISAGASPPAAGHGVSRVVIGSGLPFYPGKLRGIWLAGRFAGTHLEAAAAALQPTARLVLEPAPDDAERRLPADFRVLARQGATLVVERTG